MAIHFSFLLTFDSLLVQVAMKLIIVSGYKANKQNTLQSSMLLPPHDMVICNTVNLQLQNPLFYVHPLSSVSSRTLWLLLLSLLWFLFLCPSFRCWCFPKVLNLVCFSCYVNPTLPIIALVTASLWLMLQSLCLLPAAGTSSEAQNCFSPAY